MQSNFAILDLNKLTAQLTAQVTLKLFCVFVPTLLSLVDALCLSAPATQSATLQTAPANNRTLQPPPRSPAKIATAAKPVPPNKLPTLAKSAASVPLVLAAIP